MKICLGCIADDFTGATDLANTLVKNGMRTVQVIGVPGPRATMDFGHEPPEAIVVALKSRTTPVAEAVAESLAALDWLRSFGAEQIFFKYCSTFDSTADGNIGPVADALLDALGDDFTLVCPAFPTTGRTLFKGHLFVGDALLSDSGMRNHPLTPMTDANLVRLMAQQTPHGVGLVEHAAVAAGAGAVSAAFADLRQQGVRHAIVDAICDADLSVIGEAAADLQLITGGSGVALGLPENFRRKGLIGDVSTPTVPGQRGPAVVLSGSCSTATLGQVAAVRGRWPVRDIDPADLASGDAASMVAEVVNWAAQHMNEGPVLISSTARPEDVARIQSALGRGDAGDLVEHAFGQIARGLIKVGVRRLVVAGGETSGAVVKALGIQGLRIGPEIDPGVPWTETLSLQGAPSGPPPLALALKSGNFGTEDFFEKALAMLP